MLPMENAFTFFARTPEGTETAPDVVREEAGDFVRWRMTCAPGTGPEVFQGVRVMLPADAVPWNFEGPVDAHEIYRQSPHDPNAWIVRGIALQSVPMVAWHRQGHFHVALNGSPCLYANGCSQLYNPAAGILELRAGDDGATPGRKPSPEDLADFQMNAEKGQVFTPGVIRPVYHGTSQTFTVITFTVKGDDLATLRRAVNLTVARAFSDQYKDSNPGGYFGAYAFTTAWMNLRVNDTGRSAHWVIPQIRYANCQYNRDAFWISMMLTPEQSYACLAHELAHVDPQAEYPLMSLLWAFRLQREGIILSENDLQALNTIWQLILQKGASGWYRAHDPESGRLDFQYWADVVAFDPEDTVTYNQGLFALALQAGDELGFAVPDGLTDTAAAHYASLFRSQEGYFPQSRMKTGLTGVDMLVPEVLSFLLFGKPLLSGEPVHRHFEWMVGNGLTPWGFKSFLRADGGWPLDSDYTVPGYAASANKGDFADGAYTRGACWFIYDSLFLLAGALHGIPAAAPLLVWRVRQELDQYGTTHECLNSITGAPHKPNMGWTVAIYALMRHFVKAGSLHPQVLAQVSAN